MYSHALQDEVLSSYKRTHSYATDAILHYEHFMDHMMPFIVTEYSKIEVPSSDGKEKNIITLKNVTVQKPVVDESEPNLRGVRSGEFVPLYPNEARDRGLSYCCQVMVDIEHKITDMENNQIGPIKVYREMNLFEMPVMIGSKYCYTNMDKSRECWMDLGAYFIIRGNAKVIQPQKVQRNNMHLIKGAKHENVSVDIRSRRDDEKFRSTSTLYMYLGGSPPLITVDIPFLKPNLPIVAVFRLLGFNTRDEIYHCLWETGNFDSDGSAKRMFSANFLHPFMTSPVEDILDFAGANLNVGIDPTKEKLRRQVSLQVNGELLPHIGFDDFFITRLKKVAYLSLIVRRMIDVYNGKAETDDRDFEGHKSVQMSAGILSIMFRQQFSAMMKMLRNRIYDRCKKSKHLDVSALLSESLSRDILKAFSEGEVTVQKDASNAGTSVIQIAQQVNPLGIQTHIQRVSTALPRDGKYKQLRGVDPTQLFVFCPTETPEGHGCGLLQNLATFARVRVGTPLKFVENAVYNLKDYAKQQGYKSKLDIVRPFQTLADLNKSTKLVFVNSDPVAITENLEQFLHYVRMARRSRILPYDCSIIRGENGINISSDMGVIVFPLINLANFHKMNDALLSAQNGPEELWNAMCRFQIIEYIDAYELLEYRVAFTPEEVQRAIDLKQDVQYTHMAVHPSGFLGTSASSVPWPDHDQAPRVAYQAGMVKQAISTPASNLKDRMDLGYGYELWYPQKPVADTAIARAVGMNDWPLGENLIIAIAPYGGGSQEDSIIRNKGSVDRGSGRVTVYRVFKSTCRKRGGGEIESFEHPRWQENSDTPKCEGIRGNVNYDKIGVDGFLEEGTPIKNGDVIIGRVMRGTEIVQDGTPEGSIRNIRRDRSTIMTCEPSELYRVDKVMLSTTKEGWRTVRVKLRSVRIPQEGDKISSRHGQKGTIGVLQNEEDMPFVMSGNNAGMRPDAIINLHSINGRMTIGKLLEMLLSSLGLAKGNFVDATPFRNVNARWAMQELLKCGYGTEEIMVDGTTGVPMNRPWFIGSCFYQILKHMVLDKITVRQRGQRAVLTRQPLDGRANHGGQRMGEMEKDAFLAHGAAFSLDDRSRVASDAHTALVCSGCGHVGDSKEETLKNLCNAEIDDECRLCGKVGTMVSLPTTYCYSRLLLPELASCGIRVVHKFSGVQQNQNLNAYKDDDMEYEDLVSDLVGMDM